MSRTVAFIPVRGGSKSIPLKNIKELCGKPLVYWTAKAACEAETVDEVFIATDSDEIRVAVNEFCKKEEQLFSKLKVIDRSTENASDTASTESVMLEFADKYNFENIILVQATSPLLQGADIDGGMRLFNNPETDSVLSVVMQKRFIWKNENDEAVPANYDVYNRPRRQDFDGFMMENGAFYITSKEALIRTGNRISGHIRAYVMPEDTAVEIDEPSDFIVLEQLFRRRISVQKAGNDKEIKMIITDCDGCLTDGGMYYSENGDELKRFNTKDGFALSAMKRRGIITGIITGEDRALNKRRAEKLHMDFILQGISNKALAVDEICEKYGVSTDEILYIGDDLNDLEAMKNVGFSACPADATDEINAVSDYVSKKCGGYGAVRDIIDHFFS